ncbi:MAG: shikimate dehydrogenase [Hyphomicrobiaceae bacterium]
MSASPKAFVIGWPISHSRSPLIHGHWLKTHGIAGTYERIPVKPEELASFIGSLAEIGYAGGNVTLPHKEQVLELAAHATGTARRIGAANTLYFEAGRLVADNTDAYGFITHLDHSAPQWPKRDGAVVLLGAGGAARAIIHAFLDRGVEKLFLLNRSPDRAEQLAKHFGRKVTTTAWEERNTALADAAVLVNTTSLGMKGQPPLDIDLSKLKVGSTVADIVYVPLETPLLAEARRLGHTAVDGLGMLLHQAVPGFERWFGVRPQVTDALRAIIVRDIEGH